MQLLAIVRVYYFARPYFICWFKQRREVKKLGLKAFNLCDDTRYLPLRLNLYHHIINFWTSYGFFSENENKIVLKEIVRVLRKEGTFVIEITNPEWLVRNFQDKDWRERNDFYMLVDRSFNWKDKRNVTRWVFIDKRRREIVEITFDHRLYSLQ